MVLSPELECVGCGFGNSTTEDNAVVPSPDLRRNRRVDFGTWEYRFPDSRNFLIKQTSGKSPRRKAGRIVQAATRTSNRLHCQPRMTYILDVPKKREREFHVGDKIGVSLHRGKFEDAVVRHRGKFEDAVVRAVIGLT